MKIPDILNITVVDEGSEPVPNVAIVLVLFASIKNDYYVGPVITDHEGSVRITRADCQDAITRAQHMFLMDYAGTLESCRGTLEVRLHPPQQIETMIQQYKRSPDFWGRAFREPASLFTTLENVTNSRYRPASVAVTEQQILANPNIILQLTRQLAKLSK